MPAISFHRRIAVLLALCLSAAGWGSDTAQAVLGSVDEFTGPAAAWTQRSGVNVQMPLGGVVAECEQRLPEMCVRAGCPSR
ncbi:MAG: hypothetical protein HY859_00945 [Caulobacterales bacterium]|nr:hypothetical protein [Caulobacterales bacterium]